MYDPLEHHLIADACRAPAFDEYKRIYAVILYISKTIWCTHGGIGRRDGRMARYELFEFCRPGGVRRLATRARSKSRKSSAVPTGKNLREMITISV